MSMPDTELAQRQALAAAHRMVARNGWDDLVFTLLSARVPGAPGQLLVTPFPTLCGMTQASSLVKIDLDGNVIEGDGRIDIDGFPLYGAIHKARPDVNCILHLHTTAGVAVSAMEEGFLPMSQTAMLIYEDLAYFDYAGIGQGDDDTVRALGTKNNLLLRNHGTITVGRSVAEAYGRLHVLECACAIQVAALASAQKLSSVEPNVVKSVGEMGNVYLSSGVLDDACDNLVAILDLEEPSYAT
jgi:ribulose-5-phosphate 4-epimerase/fuculose-1-phosphate aldolase